MPVKVLVSGSSGLLGSALMQNLGADGYEITRLIAGNYLGRRANCLGFR